MPAAVVFDLDGVLIDSEEMWDDIRRNLAAEHDIAWPTEATKAMMGMSTQEWSHYLANDVGVPGTDEQVAEIVIGRLADEYEAHLPVLPGAIDAVAAFADSWPLGMASSSPQRLIDAVLHASGLAGSFEVAISTEIVGAGKPSPLIYQTVAKRLGVPPNRTVAIEDSANGIRSAAGAGMSVVAIPTPAFPLPPDVLDLAGLVLDSIRDLTPATINAWLTETQAPT